MNIIAIFYSPSIPPPAAAGPMVSNSGTGIITLAKSVPETEHILASLAYIRGEIGTFIRGKRFVRTDIVDNGVPCIHYGDLTSD